MPAKSKKLFYLTEQAKADLKEISRYTRVRWGKDQRSRYLAKLDAAYHRIATRDHLGQPYSELISDLLYYHIGSHTIYFRRTVNGVEILRILHQQQDAPRHMH